MKRRSFIQSLGLAAAGSTTLVHAQSSQRPIRIITSLLPGSAIDFQARLIAPYLSARLEQPVVVENRPGGRDIIAVTEVMKSSPDGTTLYMGSQSPMALNMALVKNLPYDPRRDLTPIAGISLVNHILVVKASSPIKTLPEFLARAKQAPGKVTVGYATSLVQMQVFHINRVAGVELLPVPYKGTPAALTDVLGDNLVATFLDPGSALPHIKSGQLRALGVTSGKRNPLTPDIPAIAEHLAGYDFSVWTGMVGPAGMRPEVVSRIHAAVDHAIRQKDVVDKFALAATVPYLAGPEQLKGVIESDAAKWIQLAREAGIQPE